MEKQQWVSTPLQEQQQASYEGYTATESTTNLNAHTPPIILYIK